MATIDDQLEVLTQKEDKRVSIKDILNTLFQKDGMKQKSILSNTNISAILKMEAANQYLEEMYNFRITQFDILIIEKLQYIISEGGRGRTDFLKVIENMRDTITIDGEKQGGFFR